MAFDAFLKIDGIPGESADAKHKDWIDVLSYGFGIQQPTSAYSATGEMRRAEIRLHGRLCSPPSLAADHGRLRTTIDPNRM